MTYSPCNYCGDGESGNTYLFDTINGPKIVCFSCLRRLVSIYEKYKLAKSLTMDNMFDNMENIK